MTYRALALSVVFVLGSSSMADAQSLTEWQDEHFSADATRLAIMDDRGGQGTGYGFHIGYDPDDFNGEDFCGHCSLAVFVADPGITAAPLVALGIAEDQYDSAAELIAEIQALALADPATLAASAMPELEGDDLDAFIMQVTIWVEAAIDQLVALEAIALVTAGTTDWDSAVYNELVNTMGIEHDSAFRADFANPNDPRGLNSDVTVYSLAELIAALAAAGVSTGPIEAALSSIPGLSGGLEISGDDDTPLNPVAFHGDDTNLTVYARSYTVGSNDTFLLVYTLVNDTPRVLPLVEVALIGDFDIPPSSYDTTTAFDPATQSVMVYDSLPLEDPEQHWWFGLTPAMGDFVFAGYNIDDRLSLTQYAPSIERNRVRWFLGDPDLNGDQDDVAGKSEKQGAIRLALPGPMLPGDQRSFAFCMSGAEAGSDAAAQIEMLTLASACQGLFSVVNPNCGDNTVQYPEECDTPGPGCDSCQLVICGDGRINGDETCDDSNATAGDGCSDTCQIEECGNGIVDVGEECDDGNLSSTDTCLNTCVDATCGDGFVFSCTGPECGGCAGFEICYRGTMTLRGTSGSPDPNWVALEDVEIAFTFAFDVANVRDLGFRRREWEAGPLHVEMTGHPYMEDVVAPSMEGLMGATMRLLGAGGGGGGRNRFFWTVPAVGPGPGTFWLQIFERGGPGRENGVTFDFETMANEPPILTTLRYIDGAMDTFEAGGANARGDSAMGAVTAGGPSAPPEACDDGNANESDLCTNACLPAACGDGIVQPMAGEECDDGPAGSATCVDCVRPPPVLIGDPFCGDSMVDPGEDCDDGNTADNDGCSAICFVESCGDGITQTGEECDDGGNGDNDGCTDMCAVESCGDGILQTSETCDTGAAVSDTDACLTTCEPAACQDGFVEDGVEECDDNNDVDGDGCSALCVIEVCGDGLFGPDEECDDGNTETGDGCSEECRAEFCGDRLPGIDEECDDGNSADGDGCDKDCRLEFPDACGDGRIDIGEQCDDGGTSDGDGCSMTCQLEDPDACGDGNLGPGESCDDGNMVDGDGCTARCTIEECGDGIHQASEGCDDGNDQNGDGCDASCVAEPAECGNGSHEYGEQCDDGNMDDADECTALCEVGPTGMASLRETCGNGMLDFGEQCDDGGHREGDGCGETCQREASVCGNARLDYGERCDDGNEEPGDGCGADCQLEGVEPPVPMGDGCNCRVGATSSRGGAVWLVMALVAMALFRRRRSWPYF